MQIQSLGENAILITGLEGPPWRLARAINARLSEGRMSLDLVEAVPSREALGLYFVAPPPSEGALRQLLATVADGPDVEVRTHEIPVRYGGDQSDLGWIAERLGLAPMEVARLHASTEYVCHAVGFVPGFAYLGDLPPALAGLPRRADPRPSVPAGAVAMVRDQTAVYPVASPGGWHLLGRTELPMRRKEDGLPRIAPGDRVRFVAIEEGD